MKNPETQKVVFKTRIRNALYFSGLLIEKIKFEMLFHSHDHCKCQIGFFARPKPNQVDLQTVWDEKKAGKKVDTLCN